MFGAGIAFMGGFKMCIYIFQSNAAAARGFYVYILYEKLNVMWCCADFCKIYFPWKIALTWMLRNEKLFADLCYQIFQKMRVYFCEKHSHAKYIYIQKSL